MRSGSATELFFASVPTTALSPSNRMTDGVIRSLSELGMICGFPYASMCATAQKVVPRSMPMALRVDIVLGDGDCPSRLRAAPSPRCSFHAGSRTEIFPFSEGELRRPRQRLQPANEEERASAETLRDHFFRTQNLIAPNEAAPDPHHDPAVVFREIRRLVADYPVQRKIDHFLRLDLVHFHAVEDLDQRMKGVLQIMGPLADGALA